MFSVPAIGQLERPPVPTGMNRYSDEQLLTPKAKLKPFVITSYTFRSSVSPSTARARVSPSMARVVGDPPWVVNPAICRWFHGDERPVRVFPDLRCALFERLRARFSPHAFTLTHLPCSPSPTSRRWRRRLRSLISYGSAARSDLTRRCGRKAWRRERAFEMSLLLSNVFPAPRSPLHELRF